MLGEDKYPSANKQWFGVFGSSGLEQVELPSTLKRIEYNAFEKCQKLREIRLPEGLEVIGKWAFENSGLTSIRLPPALREVREAAFYGS